MGVEGRDFVGIKNAFDVGIPSEGKYPRRAALRNDVDARFLDSSLDFFPPTDLADNQPAYCRIRSDRQRIGTDGGRIGLGNAKGCLGKPRPSDVRYRLSSLVSGRKRVISENNSSNVSTSTKCASIPAERAFSISLVTA
jgi:hypothetical protein